MSARRFSEDWYPIFSDVEWSGINHLHIVEGKLSQMALFQLQVRSKRLGLKIVLFFFNSEFFWSWREKVPAVVLVGGNFIGKSWIHLQRELNLALKVATKWWVTFDSTNSSSISSGTQLTPVFEKHETILWSGHKQGLLFGLQGSVQQLLDKKDDLNVQKRICDELGKEADKLLTLFSYMNYKNLSA